MEQQRDYTNTNTFEAFFKKRNSIKLINLIPDSWSFNFFFLHKDCYFSNDFGKSVLII